MTNTLKIQKIGRDEFSTFMKKSRLRRARRIMIKNELLVSEVHDDTFGSLDDDARRQLHRRG